MYSVVGCSDCSALWVLEGRPETSQCPRCGSRRQYAKRRKFVTTDDENHAREVRASMLANRQDEGDAFADVDAFEDLESRIDEAGVDDGEYLAAAGLDPTEVADAGERATAGTGGGRSRPEIVRDALEARERPDETAVVEYATERGVPADAARSVLARLVRRGEVLEDDGGYRLL